MGVVTVDLYQLETFCKVAQRLSFTKAAEELSLSQSAVSRHIEALEAEFDLPLFVRRGRGAALTEAGERLLEYAERILHLSRDAAGSLAELRNLEHGHLVVAASTTPGQYLLGRVIAAYQARYPGIDLRLEIRDSQAVLRLVEDGLVDVAVLPSLVAPPGVTAEPFLADELVLIASPQHPLAARKTVTFADLVGTVVYFREPGSNTRQVAEEALRRQGVTLQNIRELSSTETVKQAVAAGAGVSFCSRCAVALELRAGVLVALQGPELPLTRQFVLAYPKGARRSPGALAFAALLRKLRSTLEVTPS